MKKLYISILLAFFANICVGQNIRQQSPQNIRIDSPNIRPDIKTPDTKKDKKQKRKKGVKMPIPSSEPQQSNQTIPDTVYAIGTAKQHGWFKPLGIITKEQAQHRNVSVMFTRKNKKGHWTKVETINAYGGYAKGYFPPYILSNGSKDDAANKEWLSRLEGCCIIEIITDPQGENVIQERVYDENHTLLYAYSVTPIGTDEKGNKQFIGSYKDIYGLPAEMRKSEGYTYGTIVKITKDKWGYDHIIEYLDAKGVNKLNGDSVYQSVHNYDENGCSLSFGSQNSKGEYVIDSWGNCGVVQTWNDDCTQASSMYVDADWRPMKMPSEKAEEHCGVIKVLFKYDEYKREIERSFVDADNNPMVNAYGCHKIVTEYDDKGNATQKNGYDLQGQISPFNAAGGAIYKFQYDEKGRNTEIQFLDANHTPCSTKGYLSKIKKEYDTKGNETFIEQYSAETGEEKLCYKRVTEKNYNYSLWADGTSRVDSLDAKGRTTFVGFYGVDGNYEVYEGRAFETYTYNDSPKKTKQIQLNYDQYGALIDDMGYAKEEILIDSTLWTKTRWRYDKNEILTEVLIHQYSPNFDRLISQDDANQFGVLSRAGGSSSVRYYKGNVMWNLKGEKLTHLHGVDEFGDPDYITSSNIIYYYLKSGKYYDTNNKEVTDYHELEDKLPKVMTIEVTDSMAYNWGLKDNDIILAYGDYAVDLDSVVSHNDFIQEWTIRSVIDATKEKRMIVFRITNASKNEYGLYEIKGLKGTCSELGFLPHIRYLTDKQLKRIKTAVEKEINSTHPIVTYNDLKKTNNKGGLHYVILAYPEMYRTNRNNPYPSQVKDPSILLGSCIKDRALMWPKEDSGNPDSFLRMLKSRETSSERYPLHDFFFTKDGQTLTHLVTDKDFIYTKWFGDYISNEDFQQLSKLYEQALDSMNFIIKSAISKDRKRIIGNWELQTNDSLQFSPNAFLCLSKDGTCIGRIVNYGSIHYTEGEAIFKLTNNFSGTWHSSDDCFSINKVKEDVSLSCVDLRDAASEELRKNAIEILDAQCSSRKDALIGRMKYDNYYINDIFFDVTVSKNEFEGKNESGKIIKFTKTKQKMDLLNDNNHTMITPSPEQKNRTINEDSPYIGIWRSKIPNVENSHVEISLNQKGELNMELSLMIPQTMNDTCNVNINMEIITSGRWEPTSSGMKLELDPQRLNIECNFDIQGLNDIEKSKTLTSLIEGFNSQKEQFALSLLNIFTDSINASVIDSTHIMMGEGHFTRISPSYPILIGQIGDNGGYLVEKGYEGKYIILEWCDWNCRQDIDEFEIEFKRQKDNAKRIVLLPIGAEAFKDIVELDVPNNFLGINVKEHSINYEFFKNDILSRYKAFKKRKTSNIQAK